MDPFETSLFSAVLISGGVLLVIILYFGLSILRNQKRFIRLQRSFYLKEVSLLEQERARIARDLHDDLGPILSVTRMQLNASNGADPRSRRNLRTISANLTQLMRRFEEISADITPKPLLRKGLEFALRDFIQQVATTSSLQIDLRYNVNRSVKPSASIHIYRIVKELIHNCIKHAGATSLLLLIEEKGERVSIDYQDNGTGFNIDDTMEDSIGQGLRSMRNRTEMLGGQMQYYSVEKVGTRYNFELPIEVPDEKTD